MNRVDLLLRHFVTREDILFVLAAWGKHCKATPLSPMRDLVTTHVLGPRHGLKSEPKVLIKTEKLDSCTMGPFKIAAASIDANSKARWVCFDFDGAPNDEQKKENEKTHKEPLADPTSAALTIKAKLEVLNIPSYLERSSGGFGWHLWVLFDEPQTLSDARRFGLSIVVNESFALRSGGTANAVESIGLEVFPKSFTTQGPTPGTPIWLPWYFKPKRSGAGFFFDVVDGAVSKFSWEPTSFEALTGERLQALVKDSPTPEFYQPKRGGPKQTELGQTAPKAFEAPITSDQLSSGADWATWRESALRSVVLEDVYSPYLTGKSANGWLECRDFRSSTGDTNPSAGVADGTGNAECGTFHSFLRGESISIFDFLVDSGQARDFNDAVKMIADRSGVPLPDPLTSSKKASPGKGGNKGSQNTPNTLPTTATTQGALALATSRPVIVISDRQLDDVAQDAWNAVLQRNSPPIVFQRVGSPVRVKLQQQAGSISTTATIESMNLDTMTGELARVALWYRAAGKSLVASYPPKPVAIDCLSFPDKRLPHLENVVNVPVFSRIGELVTTPGYNEAARVWYESDPSFVLPALNPTPTKQDAVDAAQWLLFELFGNIDFSAQCDRCHALTALLTPFIRRRVFGPTPLNVIESPGVGAGKTLITRLISFIFTGRDAIAQPLPVREEDIQKKLLAELDTGRPLIVLDNVDLNGRRKIASGNLEAILTSEEWTDRVLGVSKMATVQNKAVWFMTGVNLEFSPGLMRRRIRIRIDPKVDPQHNKQKKFRHADIVRWVLQNRALICSKIYTVISAWFAAGEPDSGHRLDTFESWAEVLGSIATFAGVGGFLEHFNDPDEAITSSETAEWSEFIEKWFDTHKNTAKTATERVKVNELNELCERHDLLCELRGGESARSQQVRFARSLRGIRGRVFGNKTVFVRPDTHSKTLRYWLEVNTAEAQPNNVVNIKEGDKTIDAQLNVDVKLNNAVSQSATTVSKTVTHSEIPQGVSDDEDSYF